MAFTIHGTGASRGVAIGRVHAGGPRAGRRRPDARSIRSKRRSRERRTSGAGDDLHHPRDQRFQGHRDRAGARGGPRPAGGGRTHARSVEDRGRGRAVPARGRCRAPRPPRREGPDPRGDAEGDRGVHRHPPADARGRGHLEGTHRLHPREAMQRGVGSQAGVRCAGRRLRHDGRSVSAHPQGRCRARRQPGTDTPAGRTPEGAAVGRCRRRQDHLCRRSDPRRHRAHAAPGRGGVHDRVRRAEFAYRHSRPQPEHPRRGGPASLRGVAARRRRGGARRARGSRHRLPGRRRQAVLRAPPARDRTHQGRTAHAALDADGDRGRGAGGAAGQRGATRRVRRRGAGRRGRGRPLSDRVPVHESPRSAGRAGAVGGVLRARGCPQGSAGDHPYPRSRGGQAGRRRAPRCAGHVEPRARPCARCGCA